MKAVKSLIFASLFLYGCASYVVLAVSSPGAEGRTVILTDGKCQLPIRDDLADKARHVELKDRAGNVLFTGCYVRQSGMVLVLWNDGDTNAFPDAMFPTSAQQPSINPREVRDI